VCECFLCKKPDCLTDQLNLRFSTMTDGFGFEYRRVVTRIGTHKRKDPLRSALDASFLPNPRNVRPPAPCESRLRGLHKAVDGVYGYHIRMPPLRSLSPAARVVDRKP
jgi:hypothetical protein